MSDHDQPVAANVLDCQFSADRPNQRWVGDTSEFLIGGGTKLYAPRFWICTHGMSSVGP